MLSRHKYHFSFIACSSNPHHQATMQTTVVRVVPRYSVWYQHWCGSCDLCGSTGMDHVTSHMIGEWQMLYSYNLMFMSACPSHISPNVASSSGVCTRGRGKGVN